MDDDGVQHFGEIYGSVVDDQWVPSPEWLAAMEEKYRKAALQQRGFIESGSGG